MRDIITGYGERAKGLRKAIVRASGELPSEELPAEIVLNNNDLLVENLLALFSKEEAQYLPSTITKEIRRRVSILEGVFGSIEGSPEVGGTAEMLGEMDSLYAYCLQYGLVTFGFVDKEHTQVVQNVRNRISGVVEELAGLKGKVADAEAQLDKEGQDIQKRLSTAGEGVLAEISKRRDEFTGESESIAKKLGNRAAQFEADINQKTARSKELLDGIQRYLDTAKASSEACVDRQKQIDVIMNSASGELDGIIATASKANEQLVAAKSHAEGAAAQAQGATQFNADTKAKSEAAAGHLATVKQRQEEIDTFYGEIEKHEEQMLAIRKEADTDYGEMKKACMETVEDFKGQTASIADQNREYQKEIKELLHKAVSVGLFSVFKERQGFLTITRFVWAGLVFVSAIALAVGIYRLASDLSNVKDLGNSVAFFIRSGIMIPLIYLMYFAASQYRRERQTEEEYAFKSAISFSLEPYRDLLMKTRQDDELEADFIKKLMEDIFDNPVKRLYRHKQNKGEAQELVDVLASVAGKIPGDKRKILVDAIQRVLIGDVGSLGQ